MRNFLAFAAVAASFVGGYLFGTMGTEPPAPPQSAKAAPAPQAVAPAAPEPRAAAIEPPARSDHHPSFNSFHYLEDEEEPQQAQPQQAQEVLVEDPVVAETRRLTNLVNLEFARREYRNYVEMQVERPKYDNEKKN